MKETIIPWGPYIPDQWSIVRLKDIARLQSGEGITSDSIDTIGDYPVFGGNGLRGYTDNYTNEGNYVLIGRQGALCGNINYASGKFYASEHAVVVYPHDKNENTTWLGETLRATNLNRLSASAAQPGLAVNVLNIQMIPYPPKEVRKRIGNYLDEKLAKIDRRMELLGKKRDAYVRLKAATINRAVTRGLDEHVKMKDSGVEWIGMIPEHWEVKRIKDVVSLRNEKTADTSGNYIGLENIVSWNAKFIETNVETKGINSVFYKGDILFGKLRPYLAKGFLADDNGICSTEFFVLCSKRSINSIFLLYYILSHHVIDYIKNKVAGVKMPRTNWNEFGSIPFMFPPLSEQQAIACYLDEKCPKIDAAIENIGKQIDASKRLKRALINEVVTGQRAI